METLIHADIFFFITSIIVIVLAIGVAILLFYIIRIVRNFDYVVEKIKDESDNVSDDIAELRARVKEEGMKVAPILGLVSKFVFGRGASASSSPNSSSRSSTRRKTPKVDTSKEKEDNQ